MKKVNDDCLKCENARIIALDRVYTTQQVADWLGVGVESVLNYRKRGLLRGTKAGGWQFLGSDVMRFLKKNGNSKRTRKLKGKI